ncbi:MAG: polynucleotide adenylyltransferase PcnB [Thiotrichales bacterium]
MQESGEPRVIPRQEHGISRAQIDKFALKVLYRLHESGFRACLVGGGVRDLLLGREPKDFDIATDALPEQVRSLFGNCRLIGRRFRLAHVHFGRTIIEVATFRAPHDHAEEDHQAEVQENGRILRDNVYGTLEQDVWRRDFSVNALYYDIRDFSVIDYVGGYADLQHGVLRLIGDPNTRYREDPVRMLRAVRFAAKLGFRLDADSENALHDLNGLLRDASSARLFDEVLKLLHGGVAHETFEVLRHYHLFEHLFPATEAALNASDGEMLGWFIAGALESTDARVQEGKPVNPAFMIAVMLWGDVLRRRDTRIEQGMGEFEALLEASRDSITAQNRHVAFPRRFSAQAQEIWTLQTRLRKTKGAGPLRLLENGRFRAAYDFLCLRGKAGEGEEIEALCEWWTEFQAVNPDQQRALAFTRGSGTGARRRRPRKRKPDA